MSIAPDQYKCDQINRPSLIPSELTSWLYQWKVIWVDSKMNQPCWVSTVSGQDEGDQPN